MDRVDKLKYKVIKSIRQYNQYCRVLEYLLEQSTQGPVVRDEIELLTLLIHQYDENQHAASNTDPIRMLRSYMKDHDLKAKDLVDLLGVSKGYVSDILNYKKGLSKEVIRKLSDRFKVRQEAFNRPYPLITMVNKSFPAASGK